MLFSRLSVSSIIGSSSFSGEDSSVSSSAFATLSEAVSIVSCAVSICSTSETLVSDIVSCTLSSCFSSFTDIVSADISDTTAIGLTGSSRGNSISSTAFSSTISFFSSAGAVSSTCSLYSSSNSTPSLTTTVSNCEKG